MADFVSYYRKIFQKYPQILESELKYYQLYPEYTREVAYRLFTNEGEIWLRHYPLPIDLEGWRLQVEDILKVAKKKGAKCMEIHVSTCMKSDEGDAKQVELFFDFDPKEEDRYTALATTLPKADAVSQIMGGRFLLLFSGNRSWHVIVPAYYLGIRSFTPEQVGAVKKVLQATRVINRRQMGSDKQQMDFTLDELDTQAISLCHMRRALLSINCKGVGVELPIKGGVETVLKKGIKKIEEFSALLTTS